MFEAVKPGDTVRRMLGGTIPMDLKVSDVDDTFIYCGKDGWKFRRDNGMEVDEELRWGIPDDSDFGFTPTGSYLVA